MLHVGQDTAQLVAFAITRIACSIVEHRTNSICTISDTVDRRLSKSIGDTANAKFPQVLHRTSLTVAFVGSDSVRLVYVRLHLALQYPPIDSTSPVHRVPKWCKSSCPVGSTMEHAIRVIAARAVTVSCPTCSRMPLRKLGALLHG